MDVSSSSIEGGGKKGTLDELSKEDVIKKYRKLLTIAQTAKQCKDQLTEENNQLKEILKKSSASDEIIENLTQQKLALVTNFEDLKNQRKLLDDKLTKCEDQLYSSENKIADLDTENQSFKRQVVRLTDENEQLLTHLDGLEKQIEELNKLGLEQQKQLLVLEKNNAVLTDNTVKVTTDKEMNELQQMLGVSLEEIKKLKETNNELIEKYENSEMLLKEKDINIIIISQEMTEKHNKLSQLQIDYDANLNKLNELQILCDELNNKTDDNALKMDLATLKTTLNESAESIQAYQQQIDLKNQEIEHHTNKTDDLNTEIHKNRALIQKLNQDISTMQGKLSENQIVSSGLNSDLQNTNERMKDKLKLYHSKIVKFALDVKKIKEVKEYVLDNFKMYNEQVKTWKEQLIVATEKLNYEINQEKIEKDVLNNKIKDLIKELELSKTNQNDEEMRQLLKELEDTNDLVQQIQIEKEGLNERIQQLEGNEINKESIIGEKAALVLKVEELEEELHGLNVNQEQFIKEKELLQNRVEELETQIENIGALLNEKNNEQALNMLVVSKNLQEMEGLLKTIEDLQSKLNACKNLQDEFNKNLVIIEELKATLNVSQSFEEKLKQSNEIIKDLQIKVEASNNLKEELKATLNVSQSFEEKLKESNEIIKDLQIKVEASNNLKEELKATLNVSQSFEEKLKESNEIIKDLQIKVEASNNLKEELKATLNVSQSFEEKLKESNERIKDLQIKVEASNNLKEELKATLNVSQSFEEKLKESNERIKDFQIKVEASNNLKEEMVYYNQENQSLNTINHELEIKLDALKNLQEEMKYYNQENEALNQVISDLKLESSKNLEVEINKNKLEVDGLKQLIHDLELKLEDLNVLKVDFANNKEEKDSLNQRIAQLEGELERKIGLETQIDGLNEKIKHLEAESERSKSTESRLAEQSGHEIKKLVQENELITKELIKLRNITEKIKKVPIETAPNDWDEKMSISKRENSELLTEMNEMNQALKERGETISQQQAYCDEVLKKISIYEAQANKNIDLIGELEETIKRLENEIVQIKQQNLKQDKCEENELRKEIGRLQEIEEMLQKQLMNSSLVNLKNEGELNGVEINEKLLMQNEIEELKNEILALKDRSMDVSYADSECMSTSTISRADEGNRLKDLEGSWEERYGKLRTLAVKLKGKIRELTAELSKEQGDKLEIHQKLTTSLKNVQTQSDKIQDELDASKIINKDCLKKLDNAANEISKDKKLLASNDELITKLKNEIEVLMKDKSTFENFKKQVNVKFQSLKKELEGNTVIKKDFEQRILKLNNDLEAKEKVLKLEMDKHAQTKNNLLESSNERKKQSVMNLEMQDYERSIKDMSQKLERKNDLVTKLKNQVDSQKSTVNAVKEQNRLVEERVITLESDLDANQIEINALKKALNDLETIVSDKDFKMQDCLKTLENTRSENEELSTQLSKIIAEHQKSTASLKSEKDHFRSHNSGLEQRLRTVEELLKLREDELSNMQTEYQGYKVRAQSVLRQNQTRDVVLEEKLTEEAATLRAQVDILKTEIQELKSNVDKLTGDNNAITAEREKLETLKLELTNEIDENKRDYDKLSSKYQQTITEHAESVRGLKVHAETLSQCYRQQISEQEVRHNREIIELQSKIESSAPTEIPSLILPTTPREEGEGSESVDSINGNVHPLEKILGGDTDQEMIFIRKQLNDNESKVTHLTALLADTEQDLAKHVQMNKVLKEEIRRQQRSVEREKHAENLEYMKNVVFKFITLNNGDERLRLVPVLNTILKLSPEECQKLNLVAKGDRSWSNYLPLWSKPQ